MLLRNDYNNLSPLDREALDCGFTEQPFGHRKTPNMVKANKNNFDNSSTLFDLHNVQIPSGHTIAFVRSLRKGATPDEARRHLAQIQSSGFNVKGNYGRTARDEEVMSLYDQVIRYISSHVGQNSFAID